jgi:hypothetical protein
MRDSRFFLGSQKIPFWRNKKREKEGISSKRFVWHFDKIIIKKNNPFADTSVCQKPR